MERLYPVLVLIGGLVVRLAQARSYFLNPDEALHYLLACFNSFALTYQATLTTAHPPLLIVLLHYWRGLGQSELMLRLPSLLAGTASCWLTYLWVKRVADRSTAFLGLILLAFSPALIELSAEIRQYALLMGFLAACLYCSERAVQERSLWFMGLFSASLYGALLSHYSSLLFAFAMGVYMLVRLHPWRERKALVAAWAGGQVLAIALVAYFLVTHVSHLRQIGMNQVIADTWLRKSVFHHGENSLLLFPASQTVRVFTYLFSHGLLGTLALLAFFAGMIRLLRQETSPQKRPSARELALLIALPFAVNCAVAIAELYPYGGTRHNAYLAPFALTGTAIGLARWRPRQRWRRTLVVILCLAICNLFPAPPPLIRARNHKRALMNEAVVSLRQSAPPGSILFADYQSGLLLGYYACGQGVVQVFFPLEELAQARCGPYTVITAERQRWEFRAGEFADQLASAVQEYRIAPGTSVWLFEAGWRTDSVAAVTLELSRLGCAQPRHFGDNILVCRVTIENRDQQQTALKGPIQHRAVRMLRTPASAEILPVGQVPLCDPATDVIPGYYPRHYQGK
jgi:4-amino-4-deoxy-L-arabinose transferase-like glycosyltransferase